MYVCYRMILGINSHYFPKYVRESVNGSQMDIKRKTCDIRTWKNIYFSTYPSPTLIHFSHRFTNASKPAAPEVVLTVVSATAAPGRASSTTFERP
jgi:hypothetical protein